MLPRFLSRCHINKLVSQQLAYLGSDVILRLSLCLGVRAVIYFSRRATVCTHNYRRLSAELQGTIVLPLMCHTIALALKTKLYAGNQSLV